MSFVYLILAIVFEVLGTTCMKLAEGFTRLWPSIGLAVFYGISFVFLTLALRKLEVSVAYAIWAGAGTALVAAIGAFYFQESMTTMKLASIALIIAGVVGLNLSGDVH